MAYTQAQIDKANAVDLEKFLRAQGETLVRSGKEYRWKAHDSLTVCGNKWFRHSQSKGGLPVDFVMEFYGKSFLEAVQMLTGELNPSRRLTRPSPAFRLPLRNVTNANILNYLTQERKLSPSLVNFFIAAGDIYEDAAHHNVVFVGGMPTGIPATQVAVDSGKVSTGCGRCRKGVWLCPPWHWTSSCWSLKRPSTCCPSSNCSRKLAAAQLSVAGRCRARRCGNFFLNARTWSGCSSVWMLTKPERMPASVWLLLPDTVSDPHPALHEGLE